MVPAVVGGVGVIAGSFVASNVTSVLDDIANIKIQLMNNNINLKN